MPGKHPLVAERLLVEVAADDDRRWDCVEYAEDANAYHQLLQLVGFRSVALHYGADAEERDESGEQERGADDEVDEERREDEAPHGVDVRDAGEADSAERVSVHLTHG